LCAAARAGRRWSVEAAGGKLKYLVDLSISV